MNIKTEVNGSVGIATLNRPEALNALNTALLNELADALEAWDRGTEVRCRRLERLVRRHDEVKAAICAQPRAGKAGRSTGESR